MKVSDLEGALLDYWVAKAEGSRGPEYVFQDEAWHATDCGVPVFYSRRWEQGGPIIEREHIDVQHGGWEWGTWRGSNPFWDPIGEAFGQTPLIAAMRAYVASKFGDEVAGEAPLS